MNRLRSKLTYANVIATLALFVALGGASYAATQLPKNSVGPKQLKTNAVTAAKIKNGAVTTSKIAAAAQKALKGAQGPAGPRGPSSAIVKQGPVEDLQLGTGEGAALTVVSLNLASGKWVITGGTALTNVSGAVRDAWCSLDSGTTKLSKSRVLDNSSQRSTSASLVAGVDLPSGGQVALKCWADGNSVWTPATSQGAIQAIQVESLG